MKLKIFSKYRNITFVIFLFIAAMYFTFLCFSQEETGKQEEKATEEKSESLPVVKVAKIEEGTIPITLHTLGKIAPLPQTDTSVTALTAAVVTKITIKDGDKVSKGDILINLDNRAADAEMKKASIAYDAAKAELDAAQKKGIALEQEDLNNAASQARTKANNDKKEADNLEKLYAKTLVSEKAMREARQNADSSEKEAIAAEKKAELFRKSGKETELAKLKAAVEEAKSALVQSQIESKASVIKSPISGRVTRLNASIGQSIEKGTLLAEIEPDEGVGVRFDVSPSQADQIKTGTDFTLVCNHNNETLEGTIVSLGGGVDSETGLIAVQGILKGKDCSARIGEVFSAEITIGTSEKGLIVPVSALVVSDEGNFIYVVDEKNQAHKIESEILARNINNAVVSGSGLKAGEMVISDGNYNLPDATEVKVEEGK